MRFKRYTTIISKVYDGIIKESSEIKAIVVDLKERELTCKVQIEGETMQDNARIIKADDVGFTWRTIKSKSALIRTSLYQHIEQIEVNTKTKVTAALKPNPSRWVLLNPEGEAEQDV